MLDKSNIALICILGMIGGFLVSKAILSVATFFYGLNAIRGVSPRLWLKNKWWLVGLAWLLLYAVTWFWSDDKGYWESGLQVKLPFVLLPLAAGYPLRFTPKQISILNVGIALILLAGVGYSLSFLVRDPVKYIYEYKFSHLLPTPAKQDHIRFSISIVLFIIWCISSWQQIPAKAVRWFLGISIGIFVLYMHILAAKSGLLAFYLFLFLWGGYISFVKRKIAGLIVIISIPVIFMLAVTFVPTFSARKAYFLYTIGQLNDGDRSGRFGDISRLMSYKIALDIIKEHPIGGVGAGDIMTEMKKGYEKYYPDVEDSARLLPHNQFLIIAIAAGIPAALIFAIWVVVPLTRLRKNKESFFLFVVWLILLIQLAIEPVLEVQFGVFVYLFFLVLMLQQLPVIKRETPELS
jgi:O-antigen ligase